GYRAARTVPAIAAALEQTVDTSGKCVRAIYNNGTTGPNQIGDIGQYTYGQIAPSAVQTLGGNTNPPAGMSDSTTLTVPASLNPTHNGTTGLTVSTDLTGVFVDPTTNTITYIEDQQIAPTPAPTAGNFRFTRSGGTLCTGIGTPIVSGNQVTVSFTPG